MEGATNKMQLLLLGSALLAPSLTTSAAARPSSTLLLKNRFANSVFRIHSRRKPRSSKIEIILCAVKQLFNDRTMQNELRGFSMVSSTTAAL